MSKFTSPLINVKIASPCSQDWNEMIGTERTRYCGECRLNVYNLSGMSRREAENLLMNSEGRLCVRFYRRADGSVLTKDCPVGWQAVKRRVSKTAAAFASLVFAALGSIGLANYFAKTSETPIMETRLPAVDFSTTGEITIDTSEVTNQEKYYETMGGISAEQYTKGKVVDIKTTRRVVKKHRR